jgi:hypothetical protein
MKYSAEQKIYFQLETAIGILEDCESEICDMDYGQELAIAVSAIMDIRIAAYSLASSKDDQNDS